MLVSSLPTAEPSFTKSLRLVKKNDASDLREKEMGSLVPALDPPAHVIVGGDGSG